ncbi:hypothetical protein [Kitasatospora sp. McL0602]|uniref:hypothetical protein n=1 Tax=Kitasatospora sp. McL0602 TaxID=3439530 RepID=UPI003F894DE6
MRATWTAAVLTAALGLTTVTTASVNVASAADIANATAITRTATASQHPGVGHHPVVAHLPTAGVPAVPDPTQALDVLGALGGVLKLVTGLVSTATSALPVPDPAALQKLLADLQSAVQDLLGKLPAPPALPTTPTLPGAPSVGAPSVPPVLPGDMPRTLSGGLPVPVPAPAPGLPVPAPVPAPALPVPAVLSPADALAKLKNDAADLVAAATAAKSDPAAVKNLVGPLSTDAVAATTATATSLATG